jgi:hypothetical protein
MPDVEPHVPTAAPARPAAPAQATQGAERPAVDEDANPCTAPDGVSASPRSIEEAVALMNALPKPTTVACLLQSLRRPLEIYATRSELSAQPAAGEHNPRTFIVLGSLVVSVVPAGPSRDLVELGYRTSPARSIKAEIAFPLTRGLVAADLINRVQTGRVSMCAGCHVDERRVAEGIFTGTEGGFESGVIPPLFVHEIELESYRAEAADCDPAVDPERCTMLEALFGFGEVRASTLW